MGFHEHAKDEWSRQHEEYQAATPQKHEASILHEIMAGSAAFAATKAYESHQEKNGKPQSHANAKALFAGLVGAFVDREVESKGMTWIDKEKVKHEASKHFDNGYYHEN